MTSPRRPIHRQEDLGQEDSGGRGSEKFSCQIWVGEGADRAGRKNAQKAADDFEQMFVRTLVGSLRATSKLGDDGGMFGSGPGTDTYGDWFDQNLAEQIGKAQIGAIKYAFKPITSDFFAAAPTGPGKGAFPFETFDFYIRELF